MYFFLSKEDFPDFKKLYPRLPRSRMIHEDCQTKRICLGNNIEDCLKAIGWGIRKHPVYVYIVTNNPKLIVHPTQEQVPDAPLTHEIWSRSPVVIKKIGCIQIQRMGTTFFSYKGLDFSVTDKHIYKWIS